MAACLVSLFAVAQVPVYAYVNECEDEENLYVPQPTQPEGDRPQIEWPNFPTFPVIPEIPCEVEHLPYIVGYEDGTFRAERAVTREEFGTMIARLLLEGKSTDILSSFDDIRPNRYSNAYIGYLESVGIVTGYEDGSFRPFDAITTQEATVMIEKVQKIRKSNYANSFNADQTITRAEAVTTLNRVFERNCSDVKIPNLFSDLESNHWAYEEILFAAVEHTHTIK